MKAISLFTGAGGMDVGFERAGFGVVWANELMPHAAATYVLNRPGAAMHVGDLKSAISEVPTKGIDCVFGGPPCQGFSVAGKMQADDPRSELVFSFLDVVSHAKPKAFVMENVKALGKLEKFSEIREKLVRIARAQGYSANFHFLNAKDFGVPQSRERVFFIGFRNDTNVSFSVDRFAPHRKAPPTAGAVLRRLGPAGADSNPLTCKAKVTLAAKPVMRRSPFAGMIFNGLGRPINPNGVSCTLPASMGGNKTPIVDERVVYECGDNWIEAYHAHLLSGGEPFPMDAAPPTLRRLTLKEAAALQTFPDHYRFTGPTSSQYTQIGNAVPCDLAFSVASAVRDALKGTPVSAISEKQQELDLA